jgi:hypothetical protein
MRNLYYQQRVEECLKKAEAAPTELSKKLWLQMADLWREKAARPPHKMRTFSDLKRIGSPPTSPVSKR